MASGIRVENNLEKTRDERLSDMIKPEVYIKASSDLKLILKQLEGKSGANRSSNSVHLSCCG